MRARDTGRLRSRLTRLAAGASLLGAVVGGLPRTAAGQLLGPELVTDGSFDNGVSAWDYHEGIFQPYP